MVQFSFCKKLLKGENAFFKAVKPANGHVCFTVVSITVCSIKILRHHKKT